MLIHFKDFNHPLNIYADLTVACHNGVATLTADGDAIFVRFSSLSVIFGILKAVESNRNFSATLNQLDYALKKVDITVYWRSRRFAILGSNGKPFFLSLLIGLQRIFKPFAAQNGLA